MTVPSVCLIDVDGDMVAVSLGVLECVGRLVLRVLMTSRVLRAGQIHSSRIVFFNRKFSVNAETDFLSACKMEELYHVVTLNRVIQQYGQNFAKMERT